MLARIIPVTQPRMSDDASEKIKDALFRKRRLGRRGNLFQHGFVLVLVNTELDNRIPVFAGEIILVHALNHLIDGRLQ